MKAEELKMLREGLPLLQLGDRGLVLTFLQRGSFTGLQEKYLREQLAVVKAGPQKDLFTFPEGPFGRLRWHFEHARRYLTFPRIRMRSTFLDGDLVIGMVGKGSKYPGTISITSGGSFGKTTSYGRILLDGTYEGGSLSAEETQELCLMLEAMSHDLSSCAMHYHQSRNRCMFTDEEIDNPVERQMGYRRVTGLRWGLRLPPKP